jgi:hypothetical protein
MDNNSNENLNDKEIDKLKNTLNIVYLSIKKSILLEMYELRAISPNKFSRNTYNLFVKKIIPDPNNINVVSASSADDLYFLGMYYYNKSNYVLINKYLLMAASKGSAEAMYRLGCQYRNDLEGNKTHYDLMKNFYLKAIKNGNSDAMNDLGNYYEWNEKKYDIAKKYYFQAIDKENSRAMTSLGLHYYDVEKNYDLAQKYLLMAIDKGNVEAMRGFAVHYRDTRKYDLMKKYYLMAVENGDIYAGDDLLWYYCYYLPIKKDIRDYIFAIFKGKLLFAECDFFNKIINNILIIRILNFICSIIKCNDLNIDNFNYITPKIINYINGTKKYIGTNKCARPDNINLKYVYENEYDEYGGLKDIKHFIKYIAELYYERKYKNKNNNELNRKKYINKLFSTKKNISQLFMEYLNLYYYESLKKEKERYNKTKNILN